MYDNIGEYLFILSYRKEAVTSCTEKIFFSYLLLEGTSDLEKEVSRIPGLSWEELEQM